MYVGGSRLSLYVVQVHPEVWPERCGAYGPSVANAMSLPHGRQILDRCPRNGGIKCDN